MKLHVGTSGFHYKEWKGPFYPEDLKNADMLAYYAERLPSVEINNTFYRMPKKEVLEGWASQVPDGFRFSIKASRRITHMKRLKEPVEETGFLLDNLAVLGEKLGVVLFQLPPNLKKDLPRLERFLALLDRRVPAAFEFRNDTWDDDEVLACLSAHGAALVASETDDSGPPQLHETAPFGYLRLRKGDYTEEELTAWRARLAPLSWSDAFVFFKHEDEGAGPRMAGAFLSLRD
ncbi:MAG: DUF72 domain-containing protein [Myxococcota bacterium]